MAEFPDLGEHCSVSSCRQLDFLPIKCDACEKVFCSGHMTYDAHQCESGSRKDVQVPVCPLCNQPVPVGKGVTPDLIVGQHIDNDCKSTRAKGNIYSNRCNVKGCKKRELVPVLCPECNINFCFSHRHTKDHECTGPQPRHTSTSSVSKSGAAAMSRLFGRGQAQATTARASQSAGHTPALQPVQPNQLSEDEALALAMQLSLNEGGQQQQQQVLTQEQRDAQVAADLQRQEYQAEAIAAGGRPMV